MFRNFWRAPSLNRRQASVELDVRDIVFHKVFSFFTSSCLQKLQCSYYTLLNIPLSLSSFNNFSNFTFLHFLQRPALIEFGRCVWSPYYWRLACIIIGAILLILSRNSLRGLQPLNYGCSQTKSVTVKSIGLVWRFRNPSAIYTECLCISSIFWSNLLCFNGKILPRSFCNSTKFIIVSFFSIGRSSCKTSP